MTSTAPRAPAMTDVAAVAGVSHQTVSRVLNGHPSVTPHTKARVLAAISQLGYRRNVNARVLATGRSQQIGVLVQNSTLYGPSSIVDALSTAAEEADMALSIGHLVDYDERSLRRAAERLLDQGVAGIVIIVPLNTVGAVVEDLRSLAPVVTVDGPQGRPGPSVSVDQFAGAVAATEHLLGHGHATVWHVAGPRAWNDSEAREAGWRAALHQVGAEPPPVLRADWSAASGYDIGRALADMPEVTAVFAASDHIALGVLRALTERGVRVPEDVSLVGFDDVPESGFFSPPLTTVRQEFREVGRAALAALLTLVGDPAASVSPRLIAPTLVTRSTVASV